MENDYQFLVITYNQEKIIINHLKSIEYQIQNYSKGFKIHLTILDDFSTDNTVPIIMDWLRTKSELFNEVKVLKNDINIGIKENFIKIGQLVNFKRFKILAGDDNYNNQQNVFLFMDYCADKTLVFSRSTHFGNSRYLDKISFNRIKILKKHKKILKYILVRINLFSAPGSFINKDILSSPEYINHLRIAKENYEDWPSWKYLIIYKDIDYFIYDLPITNYQPSALLSADKETNLRNKIFIIITKIFRRIITPTGILITIIDLIALIRYELLERMLKNEYLKNN
jgi:hypothetical protein